MKFEPVIKMSQAHTHVHFLGNVVRSLRKLDRHPEDSQWLQGLHFENLGIPNALMQASTRLTLN